MVLLREVLGEALRHHRSAQRRTLREVSAEANVSLGYLSEIERGHKEPSSELLGAVCAALELQLSQLLAEVSTAVSQTEGHSSSGDSGPGSESAPESVTDDRGALLDSSSAAEEGDDSLVTSRPEFTACLPTSLAAARSRRRLPHAAPAVDVAA